MATSQEDNERAGSLAGLGAGAMTGARIGTALIPIPIVGTFTGAVVGGVLGSELGKRVGNVVLERVSSIMPSKPAGGSGNMPKQLAQLGKLHTEGVLTEEEFRAAKARLLNL